LRREVGASQREKKTKEHRRIKKRENGSVASSLVQP